MTAAERPEEAGLPVADVGPRRAKAPGDATRRQRIEPLERIGFTAKNAADSIRCAGPVRFLPELEQAIDGFIQSADAVARLAEVELRFLEEARDWDFGGSP